MIELEESWKKLLKDELQKDYFKNLMDFVNSEYKSKTIYPSRENVFRALNICPLESVKLVILGQDPYHGANQANGLAFSVNDGIALPPSLRNIFKELEYDLGVKTEFGNLEVWAKQGVLLLNSSLTVIAGKAGSHQKKGWEIFTDALIEKLSAQKENLVFILWGNFAKSKKKLISTKKHFIIESAHPSPLSAHRGFFGSKCFSKTNAFLKNKSIKEIDWHL